MNVKDNDANNGNLDTQTDANCKAIISPVTSAHMPCTTVWVGGVHFYNKRVCFLILNKRKFRLSGKHM